MGNIESNCKTVAIIIPTYNGKEFIDQTINSCLKQTYEHIKIVIIDDKSTDETREIISKYKAHYNVHILMNDTNLGFTRTCNKAAEYAKCDYVLFLGQDDILRENHVEEMLKYTGEDVAFVHCNAIKIDNNCQQHGYVRKDEEQRYKTENINKYLIVNNFISSTGLLINYELFNLAGCYPIKYKNYGEWMLWISLSKIGKVVYCNTVAAFYRHHSGSITRGKTSKTQERVKKEYVKECYKYALDNAEKTQRASAIILRMKHNCIIAIKRSLINVMRLFK